jgi:hypothetical protein
MARRGSFGTFNAGSSNLSATIQALVRQQMAAEEQTLMNAFYNGTTFNGSVPTMQTIIDFYNRVADLSGIQQGSTEWDALMQKVGSANNYDINQEYTALNNEFKSSSGANYEKFSSFLKGRAQDSTDPQDSTIYQNAMGDINRDYIGYRGEALGRGEITAAEYRSLTTSIIDQMDPADPKRYETLVNSYTYEWNSEKRKWDDRLTAGNVNSSQYANWAKGFQNSLVSAGISTDSTLYGAVVAAQAIAKNRGGGGGGAGSTVKTRIDKTLSEVDAIVDIALSLNPSTKARSVSEIRASGKDSLKALTDDPALILILGQELDKNPNGFPALTALGITDSSSLNIYFNDRLNSGRADSYLLASSGGPNYTESWYNASDSSGALSELAKFDFKSTQWLKDVAAANGNIMEIENLNREWEKYLSGGDSKYGSLNANNLSPEFLTLAQNEFAAMTGRSDGSLPTLSGTVNANIPLDFKTIKSNTDNANAMATGNGYQQWDDNNQEFTFVPNKPSGKTETGSYQFVGFSKVDGVVVPFVTSVKGVAIKDVKTGAQLGWVFDRHNGQNPILSDMKGNLIETPVSSLNGNFQLGFTVPEGSNLSITTNPVPLHDISGLATKTPVTFDQNNRNELGLIRSGVSQTELTISPDDLREAASKVENVLPALGGNKMAGGNLAQTINGEADAIQSKQISNSPSAATPKGRAEIARLAGNADLEKAWLFIDANKDKLEVVNGGWRWKPGTAEANTPRSDALGQAAAVAAPAFVAGGFTGIGAIPAAIGAGVAGFAQGLIQGKQSPLDTINDINKQILNNDPSMKQQRESFYYSQPFVSPNAGGSNSNVGDRFFRNFKAPAIPTNTGPGPSIPTVTSVRPSIPTMTGPRPSIPVAPVPFVAPMTQKYGAGSPFATTPIVQNQSTARRGGK